MALCKAKLNRNSLAVFLLDTACRSTMHMCTGIDQSLCLTPLVEHSTTHLLSNPAGTDKDSLVTSGKMNHVLDVVSRSKTLGKRERVCSTAHIRPVLDTPRNSGGVKWLTGRNVNITYVSIVNGPKSIAQSQCSASRKRRIATLVRVAD